MFFVSVVTLCDIFFILDLKYFLALMFFYKIDSGVKQATDLCFAGIFLLL